MLFRINVCVGGSLSYPLTSFYINNFVRVYMNAALNKPATGTVTTQAYTILLNKPQSTAFCCPVT